MGRAKQLTKKEKDQIQYLFIRNKSLRFLNKFFFDFFQICHFSISFLLFCSTISRKIKRSRNAIKKFVNSIGKYKKIVENRGRKRVTTNKEANLIVRCASNNQKSARQIKTENNLSQSTRTIQRIIRSSKKIQKIKFMKKPVLTKKHRECRLQFVHDYISFE